MFTELLPEIASQLEHLFVDTDTLNAVCADGITHQEAYEQIIQKPMVQISIDDYFAGFFTVEEIGHYMDMNCVEVHPFILPEFRNHSIQIMKMFQAALLSQYDCILTTVPDDYKYVRRVLKMIGFKTLCHKDSVFVRNGKELGLTYMYNSKRGE